MSIRFLFKKIQMILRFDGVDFKMENSSHHHHDFVRELGSYKGTPFITGGWSSNADNHVKTEIYNQATKEWNEAPEFPYAPK